MIVTETVLDVELRKCSPVLDHPRRSDVERGDLGAREPGRTLLTVPVSRRVTAAWWSVRSFVQWVEGLCAPAVAEELIWGRHCIDPSILGEPTALAAGAAARVATADAAARPTAAAPRDRLITMTKPFRSGFRPRVVRDSHDLRATLSGTEPHDARQIPPPGRKPGPVARREGDR